MKKILLILTAILITTSCETTKKESSSNSSVLLSGKLQNNSNTTMIRIGNDLSFTDIELDPNGAFKKELNLKSGKYLIIDNETQIFFNIYIPKSGEVSFTIDASKFKENPTTKFLKFSGAGKIFNEYLLTANKPILSLLDYETLSKEKDEFIKVLDSVVNSAKQTLENYPGLPSDLKSLEMNDIKYNKYECLISYKSFHDYIDADKVSKDISKDMKIEEIISLIGLSNEEDFSFSSSYRRLMQSYFEVSFNQSKKGSSKSDFVNFVSTKVSNEYILNQILYNTIKSDLSYSEDPKSYYEAYMAFSTNTEQQEEITKTYKHIKKLSPGNPSPEFTNYENHVGGTSSLSDFKGKYVFIDVWATWCSPCLREIPSFEELKQVYKDKNIEFMSISIDSEKDYTKWKDMVTERDLKGTQLIADNEWKSQFIKDYLIEGIPRFILIDPSGNIVKYNTSRPSDPKTKELLNSLLKI